MSTTFVIDRNLLERAGQVTGIREKSALVRAGLEALIAREEGKRAVAVIGPPKLRLVPERPPRRIEADWIG